MHQTRVVPRDRWVIYTQRGGRSRRAHVVPQTLDPAQAYEAMVRRLANVLRTEPASYPGRCWLVAPDGATVRDAWFPHFSPRVHDQAASRP